MKKSNQKGFMLTETLIVSTLVIGVLLFLFIQFRGINQSYNTVINYNSADALLAAENLRTFYYNDNYSGMEEYYRNNHLKFLDLTNCPSSVINLQEYCNSITSKVNVKKVLFTDADLNYITQALNRKELQLEPTFEKYIRSLENDEEGTLLKYRIIVELNSGEFGNIKAGNGVPGTIEKTGYKYVKNADLNETYAGILYLDPTDLSAECDASSAVSTTNTKSGCMKWFAFGDDGNGNPTTAILDHNTTALAVYDFENKNSEANGRVQNDYEADWQLAQDTSNWDSSLSARFPTADEIANAGGTSGWSDSSSSTFYFGGGNSASQNGKYWWLYTNLNGVEGYNGQGNDNNSYQHYSNASGSTSSGSMYGYWTSTPRAGFANVVWYVRYKGHLDYFLASYDRGVRPVISLSALKLK